MNEQKRVRKQLYKNMMYIYVVFIILFLFFDLIIYNKISNSMYENVDKQLNNEVQRYSTKNNELHNMENPPEKKPEDIKYNPEKMYETNEENDLNEVTEKNKDNSFENREKINPKFQDVNPRLICIVRNSGGEIINESSIGRIYENYLTDISFDKNNIQNTYMIKVGNQYNYRGITVIDYDEDGDLNYIQFLANVDGEIESIENLKLTLIAGTVAIIVISIIASYVLSKRALNPIMVSWRKQTEFVQNASHELRTPLTVIQAKQELLLQTPNDRIIDKSEDINISLNETRRLSKLIKDLMILARSDSNEVVLDKKEVEIDSLIKNMVTPYIEFAEIEGKTLKTDLKYGKKINIDEDKINQLMVILLDNAIKYTAKGDSITIRTYSRDNRLNIEVLDTGIGISKEGAKHAFDRFFREDKARSRETGGSGLGLSIAYMITQLHGGSIKIGPNDSKGTRVIVKI